MKRNLSVFLIISILLISLVGCSSNSEVNNTTNNTVNNNQSTNTSNSENNGESEIISEITSINIAGLKGPTSIGMIKLFEEKPSLGENSESNYEVANTPDIINAKLINKEVDIAALPTNVASIMYNKTKGAYKLASINTFGMLYLVTNNTEISSWEDLKGQKVNVFMKGSTPDFLFSYLLKQNNIDSEKDLELDYSLAQAELAQAIIADKVNIAVIPEPFVTMVTMKNINVKIAMNLQDEWEMFQGENTPIPMGCIVVRTEFAEQHPEIVNNFLKEYENSINWVNENSEQAGILVEKHGILDNAKLAEKAIPNCNIKFLSSQDGMETVNSFLNILYNFNPKSVGGNLPDENFFYKE